MAFKIAVSNQKVDWKKTTISVNIAAAFEAGGQGRPDRCRPSRHVRPVGDER